MTLMGVERESEEVEAPPLVMFPPEVQAAIETVLPSEDPLDSPDLNVVTYINKLFPSEQSLVGLEDTMADLSCQVSNIDEEMRLMVRSQTQVGGDAAAALEDAQTAIIQLFGQIREIKNAAEDSEEMVKEITRDIKQLDTAKRNLSMAITTLNHLSMLVRGTATLTQLSQTRQYGEAALLLQGLLEVLNHFKSYQNIPQIKELSDQVETIKKDLGDQIMKDFDSLMTGGRGVGVSGNKQLAEACLVVSVLEPRVKRNLISWFTELQLKEYTILFAAGEDEAWLDRLDSRYNWLKKHLIEFEERFGPLFPPDWEMSERIAGEFCRITRLDLTKIIKTRQAEVDTKLLLHAIQKTAAFESLLSRRFSGVTLNISSNIEQSFVQSQAAAAASSNPFGDPDSPNNPFHEPVEQHVTSINYQSVNLNPFKGIISQCFEPYLHIYLEAQDRNLSDMISRFSGELSSSKAGQVEPGTGEGAPVLTSCGDLFVFYRKCLVQLSELSSGQPMLDLATLFKKYLREYISKVIVASLPKVGISSLSEKYFCFADIPTFTDWKHVSRRGLCSQSPGHESVVSDQGPLRAVSGHHWDTGQLQLPPQGGGGGEVQCGGPGGDLQQPGHGGVLPGHHPPAPGQDEAEGGGQSGGEDPVQRRGGAPAERHHELRQSAGAGA